MKFVQDRRFSPTCVHGLCRAILILAGLYGFPGVLAAEDHSYYLSLISEDPAEKVTMRVYNYAHVPRPLLDRAESEASAIFANAGTTVEWVDCPLRHAQRAQFPSCRRPFGLLDYVLNLLPESMATRAHLQDTTFGFARLSSDGEHSFFASVFWDRISNAAQGTGLSAYQLLGHSMAHEMGHLMLGSMGHTSIGLMSARWGPVEFKVIARGYLLFTNVQSQQMRAETLARIEAKRLVARRTEVTPHAH